MDSENRVQWIYSSKNNKELEERYDQWAAEYDADLEKDFGWAGPQLMADLAADYVEKDARILDAGAGTGLVGVALKQNGYHNLVAGDLSEGMLKQADQKGVYRELHQVVLGESMGFETDAFDAVVSVGVFTEGHAPCEAFDELVRVTRPGGHVMFTLRPDVYEENGFKEKQSELESNGSWKRVKATEPLKLLPTGEPELGFQIWVYQVL